MDKIQETYSRIAKDAEAHYKKVWADLAEMGILEMFGVEDPTPPPDRKKNA